MSKELTFNELREVYFKRLDQFVPIVDRVHGPHHPEFHDVRKVYEAMSVVNKKAGSARPELEEGFKKLREITSNYEVPGDVCETYEAVYNMLEEADKAYFA